MPGGARGWSRGAGPGPSSLGRPTTVPDAHEGALGMGPKGLVLWAVWNIGLVCAVSPRDPSDSLGKARVHDLWAASSKGEAHLLRQAGGMAVWECRQRVAGIRHNGEPASFPTAWLRCHRNTELAQTTRHPWKRFISNPQLPGAHVCSGSK